MKHWWFVLWVLIGWFISYLPATNLSTSPPDPYRVLAVLLKDTIPLKDRQGDYVSNPNKNPFDLKDPNVIDKNVTYDPVTGRYVITEKIGNDYFRMPTYMTLEEYYEYKRKEQDQAYFRRLSGFSGGVRSSTGITDPVAKIDVEKSLIDRLFGGTTVDIKPQGFIDLTFGGNYQNVKNPLWTERQQQQFIFDFDMGINLSASGKIGEKLKLDFNYNSQANFDFDQQMKLAFDSDQFSEDDIIKKIEAGNVSLPLKSSLIKGSQNLFGVKMETQFGRLKLSGLASQQRSRSQSLQIQGGALVQESQVYIQRYDENRHFLVSHYNRESFEEALSNLPQISTLFTITRMEVWVTNDRNETQNVRDIMAIADLGEYERMTNNRPGFWRSGVVPPRDYFGNHTLPDNNTNAIYQGVINTSSARNLDQAVATLESGMFGFQQVRDFEKVRARLLTPSEYTFHPQLGFISLNLNLRQDQVLAVAYEYVYKGKKYQVGELSLDSPNNPDTLSVLYVKLLKGTAPRIDLPTWDLMMKNFYSINAYQVEQEDFSLDVFYEDPGKGLKRFLPAEGISSVPLISLFNLDNLNQFGDPQPDGVFDFVPGLTIFPQYGRFMFPVLEPFGSSLAKRMTNPNDSVLYTFQPLYDSTLFISQEFAQLNRYVIKVRYKSSSAGGINLGGFNIPDGSVRINSGGQQLQEGVDYRVENGQVKMLNEGLQNSQVPVDISYEDNSFFGLQNRTMLGLRAEYDFKNDLVLGGTMMRLFERPFTQKVNVGDDPINNSVYGLDMSYTGDAPWLTKFVDALPLLSTKAKSRFSTQAEVAALKPGHSRAINSKIDKGGITYLDDFEGSTSSIDLKVPYNAWVLASVPQNNQYPEGQFLDSTISGVNRALLNWYRLDGNTPGDGQCDNQDPYVQQVTRTEIFPQYQQSPQGYDFFSTFDLTYYPKERGQYNFESPRGTAYSPGLNFDGTLKNPESRWAGIMRSITYGTDFEENNVEYVEFWLLNPFMSKCDGSPVTKNGKLFMELGNISEDILRDSRRMFENGLPRPGSTSRTDTTSWSRIPRVQPLINAFDNDPAVRELQDVGLDGVNDEGERTLFANYLNQLQPGVVDPKFIDVVRNDPANDNFKYFRDFNEGTSILNRYKNWNNTQGNSRSPEPGQTTISSYTNYPDNEDLNKDNTLNESEGYYQYEIPINQSNGFLEFNEFITDSIQSGSNTWYRFKIPITQFTRSFGSINGFRSIRFIRLILKEFDERVTFRFASFELVRNQWRRLRSNLCTGDLIDNGDFDLNEVNVEEHNQRQPFNYVLPKGIQRENLVGPYPNLRQNEQSLSLDVCGLIDGCARGIYKDFYRDLRNYERLKMFVHAESQDNLDSGALRIFMRIGQDFINNYYEYEIPLVFSDRSRPSDADEIWKESNAFDFPLQLLVELKKQRNNQGIPLTEFYSITDPDKPKNTVRIIGNPNIGLVKNIMIGLRNPADDGTGPICADVWINELRVTGLDERGGVAGVARMDFQLADFGNVTLAGNFNTIGWGAIDERVEQRSKEAVMEYNLNTNLELHKFLGENTKLRLPLFFQYANTNSRPLFDPYDLDVTLQDKLRDADSPEIRDSIATNAQTRNTVKSLNFTDVRKVRADNTKKPKPWDIENFSATYVYSAIENQNPIIEADRVTNHRGELEYNFTRQANYLQPFKNVGKKSKYMKLISELNINPLPNNFTVNTTLNRIFGEKSYRFSEPEFKTWFNKRFNWDRTYVLQWDLTKSLKLNFTAENNAVIDEPDEYVNRANLQRISKQERRDSILSNLKDFGRNKNYLQNLNLSYTLPTKHIPILDWITARATLGAQYSWSARALNVQDLGNILQNSQNRNLTADFNFESLYNKWGYLKKINGDKGTSSVRRPSGGQQAPARPGADAKKDQKESREVTTIEKILIRPLLLVRKARFTYSENISSVVPGFTPAPSLLGLSKGFEAPGWNYALGFAPSNQWLESTANKGWISGSPFLNDEMIRNSTLKYDAQVTLEPFTDFRIEIMANKNYIQNHSEFFRNCDTLGQSFLHQVPRDLGSYTVSYMSIKTLFDNDKDQLIEKFKGFEETRKVISQRQGTGTHAKDGADYTAGYGRYQQDVLVPAFLAAYTGATPNEVSLDVFKTKVRPNWQVSYNGLNKLPWFSDMLASFNLTHGYKSTITINSYQTNIDYLDFDPVSPQNINPLSQNYYSRFDIPNVINNESFSPLIGVDLKTRNNISIRFDMAITRNLALNLTDFQVIETNTEAMTFGAGYTIQNINIPFLSGKGSKRKTSRQRSNENAPTTTTGTTASKSKDLNFKLDYSVRDDITINHILDQETSEATRGTKTVGLTPSIDYQANDNVNLRFFVDYRKTVPATTQAYPITSVRGGLTVRLSLN